MPCGDKGSANSQARHGDLSMINPAAIGDSSRLGTRPPMGVTAARGRRHMGTTRSHMPWDQGHSCITRQRVMSMEWGRVRPAQLHTDKDPQAEQVTHPMNQKANR